MNNIGIYPGSFDPITYGHLDIIYKASKIFSKVYIAILDNSMKTNPLFTNDEKINLIKDAIKDYNNVEVISFSGLTVNCAKEINASVIIRGLRSTSDFEYEMEIAKINDALAPEIDTMFLTASNEKSFISSSAVKEIAKNNGDISKFTTQLVIVKLKEKLKK